MPLMRMQMRPTFTAMRTRLVQNFVPPPILRRAAAQPVVAVRRAAVQPVVAVRRAPNVMRPSVFKATPGVGPKPKDFSVPCWFEPGVDGSVTACCDKGDGKLICATLVEG